LNNLIEHGAASKSGPTVTIEDLAREKEAIQKEINTLNFMLRNHDEEEK